MFRQTTRTRARTRGIARPLTVGIHSCLGGAHAGLGLGLGLGQARKGKGRRSAFAFCANPWPGLAWLAQKRWNQVKTHVGRRSVVLLCSVLGGWLVACGSDSPEATGGPNSHLLCTYGMQANNQKQKQKQGSWGRGCLHFADESR